MKTSVVNIMAVLVFIISLQKINAQNVAITDIESYVADNVAMLDVYSTNKGMLVPRIALISTTNPISVSKPVGLLVWNTSTIGTYAVPGFYYWNGTDWAMVGTNAFTISNGLTQSGKNVKLGGSLTENTTITTGNYNAITNLTGTGTFNIQNNGASTLLVSASSNVGIGTASPAGTSVLDITSTSKGVLVPRMTTTQRMAITSPANGLLVFDTNYGSFFYYNTLKSRWTLVPSMPTASTSMSEALFAVLNQNGDTVFAVYPEGVQINVGNGVAKGTKGGFAVASMGAGTKAAGADYFRITKDSIRMYVEEGTGKGTKGGFAVASMGAGTKGISTEVLRVTDDSVRVYIKDVAKGTKGGFAVASMGAGTKASGNEYMQMTKDNYFIGLDAGASATTGLYNSFMGFQSGMKTKDGSNNSFIGFQSGLNNTSGADNVFIGYQSGLNNLTGLRNVLIGKYSGKANTTGFDNVFLGHRAGEANTEGSYNVFLGERAGWFNTLGEKNIFVGVQAGNNNTDGDRNIFIGDSAGFNNTTGLNNIILGTYAGVNDTKGYQNVYIGYKAAMNAASQTGLLINYLNVVIGGMAGMSLNGSNGCTFVGNNSGYNSTTVSACSFFGAGSGKGNTTGVDNTFLGYQTGFVNTIGYHNTYIGSLAGYSGTGNDNTMLGYYAGHDNSSGAGNVYIGTGSGAEGASGSNNAYLGFQSGYNSTGSNNVYLGFDAGQSSTIGNNNVFLGDYSGYACTGSGNVFLGSGTGYSAGTGANNVFIGFQAGYSESGSNKLYIDNSNSTTPLIYGDFSSDIVTINGQLGIDTKTPSYDISFSGASNRVIGIERRTSTLVTGASFNIKSGGVASGSSNKDGGNLYLESGIATGNGSSNIYFNTATAGAIGSTDRVPDTKMVILGNGNVGIGNTTPGYKLTITGTAWCTAGAWASDIRLKKNINTFDQNVLEKLMQLNPVNFEWSNPMDDGMKGVQMGFIAQDVEQVFPSMILTTNDNQQTKSIKYGELFPVLVSAIQEQQKQIESLKSENQEMKNLIDKYSTILNELEELKSQINK